MQRVYEKEPSKTKPTKPKQPPKGSDPNQEVLLLVEVASKKYYLSWDKDLVMKEFKQPIEKKPDGKLNLDEPDAIDDKSLWILTPTSKAEGAPPHVSIKHKFKHGTQHGFITHSGGRLKLTLQAGIKVDEHGTWTRSNGKDTVHFKLHFGEGASTKYLGVDKKDHKIGLHAESATSAIMEWARVKKA